MTSCIYAITHLQSGKQYVGSTINYKKRFAQHRCALRNNRHHSFLLQRSYNKYGLSAFSFLMLEDVEPANLEAKEQEWLLKLKPVFNCTLTTNRHMLGKKTKPCSEETKAKIRAKVKGYKHTDEAKEKMKGINHVVVVTDKHRQILAENGKRRGAMGQTKETIEKIRKLKTGVQYSEETKSKKSASLKGKPWTEARKTAQLTAKKAGAPVGKPWSEARRKAQKQKS